MIFCIINGFPAYGNLLGYRIKGGKACPICEDDTSNIWLTHIRKTIFMGHRRYLPYNHTYGKRKKTFNEKIESG